MVDPHIGLIAADLTLGVSPLGDMGFEGEGH